MYVHVYITFHCMFEDNNRMKVIVLPISNIYLYKISSRRYFIPNKMYRNWKNCSVNENTTIRTNNKTG